jgi:hypothetical protein
MFLTNVDEIKCYVPRTPEISIKARAVLEGQYYSSARLKGPTVGMVAVDANIDSRGAALQLLVELTAVRLAGAHGRR